MNHVYGFHYQEKWGFLGVSVWLVHYQHWRTLQYQIQVKVSRYKHFGIQNVYDTESPQMEVNMENKTKTKLCLGGNTVRQYSVLFFWKEIFSKLKKEEQNVMCVKGQDWRELYQGCVF